MAKSGIINNGIITALTEEEIIDRIKEYLELDPQAREDYYLFLKSQLIQSDFNYIEFAVKVLGWNIVVDDVVFYQKGTNAFNKIDFFKNGIKLNALPKLVHQGKRFCTYRSPGELEAEMLGMQLAESEENALSFWYPKTSNIGFKTPETLITPLTKDELKVIKTYKFADFPYTELLKRIKENAKNQDFDLNRELFLRTGYTSNKFDFSTCHLKMVSELPERLMANFDSLYNSFEWKEKEEIILREFIKTQYEREKIYNGLPLNTEFRVFYDFDTHEILGTFNYWDTQESLDSLNEQEDLKSFITSCPEIEAEFRKMTPYLEDEIQTKLPQAEMHDKWSIDFMYDGKNFILIDMARAECSHYYSKVIDKKLNLQNKSN